MNDLTGKVFIVAGGSTGIGLQLVRQLSSANATVRTYSRTNGELTPDELTRHATIDFAKEPFEGDDLPEKVDGAVYCPGTINLRSFRALKIEDFQHDLNVNLIGAIKFLKACFPALKKAGTERPSSVVMFSTVAVAKGLPMHASIAAAKGAIEGLSRTLASEWAPQVRVNCLAPALTATPLAEKFISTEEKKSSMAAKYPMARIGEPTDIASMAKFLLSDESSWITGQVIGIDGGMSSVSK